MSLPSGVLPTRESRGGRHLVIGELPRIWRQVACDPGDRSGVTLGRLADAPRLPGRPAPTRKG